MQMWNIKAGLYVYGILTSVYRDSENIYEKNTIATIPAHQNLLYQIFIFNAKLKRVRQHKLISFD